MRGIYISIAIVLAAIVCGVGVMSAIAIQPIGFACPPLFPAANSTVRLVSGTSEWVLSIPAYDAIAPPTDNNDPARVFAAICFGPEVPRVLRGGDPTQVRVAWKDSQTEVWRIGPVVMAYDALSDTALASALDGDSVWLYDPLTTEGSEAIEVSSETGAILESVRVPPVFHPAAYTSRHGFWIYDYDQGPESPRYAIYHVSPGGSVTEAFVRSLSALPS